MTFGRPPHRARGGYGYGSVVRSSDLANLHALPVWTRSLISPGTSDHPAHIPDHGYFHRQLVEQKETAATETASR